MRARLPYLEKQTENAEDSKAAAQRAEFAAVVFIIIFPGGSARDWKPAKNSSLSRFFSER
jgi:hypothetical protein